MTYTAIRHTTKSGKLSNNYNVVDIDGSVIGCCTSLKSATTLSKTLNSYVITNNQNQFLSSLETATPFCDERSLETGRYLRRNYVSTCFQTTISHTSDSECVVRSYDSEKGSCDTNATNQPGTIRKDVLREPTDSFTSSSECLSEKTITEPTAESITDKSRKKAELFALLNILKTNGDSIAAGASQFLDDAIKLATESRQLATDSRQLATESRQLATESRQLATESRQLATDSRQLATESRQLATSILSTATGLLSVAQNAVGLAVRSVGDGTSDAQGITIDSTFILDEPCIDVFSIRVTDKLLNAYV